MYWDHDNDYGGGDEKEMKIIGKDKWMRRVEERERERKRKERKKEKEKERRKRWNGKNVWYNHTPINPVPFYLFMPIQSTFH